MKCVMVVDANLPLGLLANTVAVLAVSIGHKVDGIVGDDVYDRDGTLHKGITEAVIPLLKGDSGLIRSLRMKLMAMPEKMLYSVDFCDMAQKSKHYADYKSKMAETAEADLNYLGIAIYGEDKDVNKLTGSIGLLR
jgi:hypothetical protein